MRGRLEAEEIQKEVLDRLTKYDALSVLEQFAVFMGTVQVLELGLKNLLCRRYKLSYKTVKRWTLGTTTKELKSRGLRSDYVRLLESLVWYRNHVAHELLANDAMLRMLLRGDSGTLELRQLWKGAYELEQAIFLYDWCEEHEAWG